MVKTVKLAGLTSLTPYLRKIVMFNCIYMAYGEAKIYFVVEFVLLQRFIISYVFQCKIFWVIYSRENWYNNFKKKRNKIVGKINS